MGDYNRGGHTKYSLKVHPIFVTKYRKGIFKLDTVSDDVKKYLYDCAKKYDFKIIQMETDTDHVHILLDYDPEISVSVITKYLKQYSTYHLWKKYDKYLY